jgi:hypothetical protein
LLRRLNLDQLYVARANLLSKPVILYSIVLRTRRHAARLELTKCESPYVVFMDADVKVDGIGDVQTKTAAKLLDKVNQREELFARGAQSNIL